MKLYTAPGAAELSCPKGHRSVSFYWFAGSEHVEHHDVELTCECGHKLVHVGGDDPWAAEFVEVEGRPHGA